MSDPRIEFSVRFFHLTPEEANQLGVLFPRATRRVDRRHEGRFVMTLTPEGQADLTALEGFASTAQCSAPNVFVSLLATLPAEAPRLGPRRFSVPPALLRFAAATGASLDLSLTIGFCSLAKPAR